MSLYFAETGVPDNWVSGATQSQRLRRRRAPARQAPFVASRRALAAEGADTSEVVAATTVVTTRRRDVRNVVRRQSKSDDVVRGTCGRQAKRDGKAQQERRRVSEPARPGQQPQTHPPGCRSLLPLCSMLCICFEGVSAFVLPSRILCRFRVASLSLSLCLDRSWGRGDDGCSGPRRERRFCNSRHDY